MIVPLRQLTTHNVNGGGASDVCFKTGTSLADGSVNSTAKLLSVCTGIGGTEVEKLSILKDGTLTTAGDVVVNNRSVSPHINVIDYGADPTGVSDSSTAINNALQDLRTGATKGILYIPEGTYKLLSPLITESLVTIRGAGVNNTIFVLPNGVTGWIIGKGSTAPHGGDSDFSSIGGFSIIGPESYQQWDGDPANGISLHANGVELRDLYIFGMQTHAIEISSSPVGTNCNSFKIHNLTVYYCGGDGLYIHGGDTNAGATYDCSVTGCGGSGLNDSSFLGNLHMRFHTEANMTHAFNVVGANNMSLLIGCYSESDQTSYIDQSGFVIGGDHGAPISGTGFWDFGTSRNKLVLTESLKTQQIRADGITVGMGVNNYTSNSLLELYSTAMGTAAFRADVTGYSRGFIDWVISNQEGWSNLMLAVSNSVYRETQLGARFIPPGRIVLKTDTYGDWLEYGMPGLYLGYQHHTSSSAAPSTGSWCIGDIHWRHNAGVSSASAGPLGWVCTSPGTFGTYSEGRSATMAVNVAAAVLDSASSVLIPGKWVEINSHKYQILPQITWRPNTAYQNTVFEVQVLRSNAGNIYRLTGNGTSGSTGPTGTGGSITDGTCTWAYVGATGVVLCFDGNVDTFPTAGTFSISYPTPVFKTLDASMGSFGSTPNSDGASFSNSVLTLQPADATHPGCVSTAAQTFGGIKTFAGIVSPSIYNTNGSDSADICVKGGTSLDNASVHIGAKLLSLRTGIGGTEVEKWSFSSGGVMNYVSTFDLSSNGTAVCRFSTGVGVNPRLNAYYAIYFDTANGGIGCNTAVKLTSEAADGASAVATKVDTTTAWTNTTAKLLSIRTNNVEKAAITADGSFIGTGGGVSTSDASAGWSIQRWYGATTDATATEIFLNGVASSRATLSNNSSVVFKVMVVGRDDTNNVSKAWEITGLIHRGASAATTAMASATSVAYQIGSGADTWTAVVSADTTNGSLNLTVTGASSTTIRWSARLDRSAVNF